MAGLCARIGECLAGFRDELPVVTTGMQCQLKHTKGSRIAHLAVRSYGCYGCVIGAPVPTMNSRMPLPGPMYQWQSVAQNVHRYAHGRLEPDRHARYRAVARTAWSRHWHASRTKQGNMPVRQGALVRWAPGPLQPFILRRAGAAPARLRTIRIQGDQVPGSDIKTVIPCPTVPAAAPKYL